MRSWTRHDKAMHTTVGPGTKGPPWHTVVRRVVYDARTGDKLLEELIDASTPMRRRLQCESDIISVFMYRTLGSGRSMSTNSMSVAPPTVLAEPRDGPTPQAGELREDRGLPESPRSREGAPCPGGRRRLPERLQQELEMGPRGDAGRAVGGEASCQEARSEDFLCSSEPPPKESFQVGRQQGEIQRGRETEGTQDDGRQEPQADALPDYEKGTADPGLQLYGATDSSQNDHRGAEGPGGRAGGAVVAVHGPDLHRDRGLEGDKSVLGGASQSPRGGTPDCTGSLADAGCSQSGCGQADLEWRSRIPTDPHRRGRAQPRGPAATQAETVDETGTSRAHREGHGEKSENQGVDRPPGQLPDALQSILGRPGDQRGLEFDVSVADVQVEADGVDASHQTRGRDGIRGQLEMEEEPEMADDDAGKADCFPLGPLGSGSSAMQRPEAEPLDERKPSASEPGKRPSRGLMQKMKKGVSNAQRAMSLLTLAATIPMRWHLLEIFSTSAPWHRYVGDVPWKCSGPLWAQSYPPSEKQCQKLMAQVQEPEQMPDLVIVRPMCGPWSPWTREKGKTLRVKQQKYVPMWEFVEALWRYQVENKRLILLMIPARMLCPGRDELRILGATGYLLPDGPQDPTVPLRSRRLSSYDWGGRLQGLY